MATLRSGKRLPVSHSLCSLNSLLGFESWRQTTIECWPGFYPITSPMVRLLLLGQLHISGHAGPTTMLSLHIVGVKQILRSISHSCTTCQQAYIHQQMGLLPTRRVQCTPPFFTSDVDFASPLLCRRKNQRKPVRLKCYDYLFVCLSTEAVHIEFMSELTSDAFLVCFTWLILAWLPSNKLDGTLFRYSPLNSGVTGELSTYSSYKTWYKWFRTSRSFCVTDIVIIKDKTLIFDTITIVVAPLNVNR